METLQDRNPNFAPYLPMFGGSARKVGYHLWTWTGFQSYAISNHQNEQFFTCLANWHYKIRENNSGKASTSSGL